MADLPITRKFVPYTPEEKKESDVFWASFDTKVRCPQCRQGNGIISQWCLNETDNLSELVNRCIICGTQWITLRGDKEKIIEYFKSLDDG